MPLNFISDGGGAAFIRYSVEENEWSRSSSGGDLVPVDLSGGVLVDIKNVKLGWLKLQGGRDWVEWPNNDPTKAPKPSDAHKQGISVQFYSTKLFDDEPVRELCSSQTGINMFIKKLYEECEGQDGFKNNQCVAVKITRAKEKIKVGAGSTRVPSYEIVKWMDRPSELGGGAAAADSPAEPPVSVANDDVNFAEI